MSSQEIYQNIREYTMRFMEDKKAGKKLLRIKYDV